MRININNTKIINNKLPLFFLFCFLWIIYLGTIVNYWYFLLLTLLPFTLTKNEINCWQLLTMLTIFFIFCILILFASKFSLLAYLKNDFIRKPIFNFLDNHYSKEISSYIKLILFNVRSTETYVFLKQTIDLGVVWLICVSGFHISLLTKIIRFLFKKIPMVGRYVNIGVVLIYSALLNFSYASIRILLKLCFESFFRTIQIKSFNRIGFIGICICLLNPSCFSNIGFILTFTISIGANLVNKLKLNNKLINLLLINITSFIITIPFVIKLNHKISLFTFINSFIFNYISSFIFLYFLIFAWMPFMQIIHYWIMVCSYVLVGNISFSNIFIYSRTWEPYLVCIYYITLFFISKIIYLIVYNNKI